MRNGPSAAALCTACTRCLPGSSGRTDRRARSPAGTAHEGAGTVSGPLRNIPGLPVGFPAIAPSRQSPGHRAIVSRSASALATVAHRRFCSVRTARRAATPPFHPPKSCHAGIVSGGADSDQPSSVPTYVPVRAEGPAYFAPDRNSAKPGDRSCQPPAQAGADVRHPQAQGAQRRPDLRGRRAGGPARRLRLPAHPRDFLPGQPGRHLHLALADPPLQSAHRRLDRG